MTPSERQPVERQVADPDEALLPDGVAGEQLVEAGQARVHDVAELEDALLGALGEVLDDAAGPDERVVHAQAGEELEQVQDLLALPEAVGHAGERAELHAAGGEGDQVRADPVDLHEEHPDDLRPASGTSMPSRRSIERQYAVSLNSGAR